LEFNLDKIFEGSEQQQVDIFLNSYYSFLFLKKNSFYDFLKANTDTNSPAIRLLISCKDGDQYDSIVDFFKPFKNVQVKNVLSSAEPTEHMITIITNQNLVSFFKIDYNTDKRMFTCKLSDSLTGDIVTFFYILFVNIWSTIDKNIILEKRNIFQQDFVDIASHQLRNPILPIIGFSKTLKSKIEDPDMLDYLNIIIKNAEKL
jgi:hypothetical protein